MGVSHRDIAAHLTPGDGPVLPRYDGYATVNLVATLLANAGAAAPMPPLAPGLLPSGLLDGVQRVVLFVVDALGYRQLLTYAGAGAMPNVEALIQRAASGDGAFFPLTTVFPSTTAAALSSVFTGAPPAAHGLLSYTVYLPEVGDVTDLVFGFRFQDGSPVTDFTPVLNVPSSAELLAAVGVPVTAVNDHAFADSLLTAVHHRGATQALFRMQSVLPAVTGAAAARLPLRSWLTAYWHTLDLAAHLYGPFSPELEDEANLVDTAFGRLLRHLQAAAPQAGKTLVVLLADHGQTDLDPERSLLLRNHPDLLDRLRLPPAGERRSLYLYPRPGEEQAVQAWAEARGARVLAAEAAWAGGWFGGPPGRPAFTQRVGDLIVLPPGGASWVYNPLPARPGRLLPGAHGGQSPEEMLVPCLITRV